jgi:hypothetical protein
MLNYPQLLPSPKWKLVVDVGEPGPVTSVSTGQSIGNNAGYTQGSVELSDTGSEAEKGAPDRDPRIYDVVSLLGELMPSDPNSALAPYLSGFMSLRLLLLRPSRSPEEEEHARTMLDSFSSYSQGVRSRIDIGVMLARDYMFLCQQKSQQPFFSSGQSMVNNSQAAALPGYSVFDVHNSPTLAPIAIGDAMSIVSH